MRYESSVTTISWIPSEAMTGPMRVPMDLGIGHYDSAPPEEITSAALETLKAEDRYRFANNLSAWIEVDSGEIVDAGYSGTAHVGSTTAKLGMSITIPGVGFPLLQETPRIEDGKAVFKQTGGGRTGAPLPRRIDRPPYVRMTAPTAWTTLELSIDVNGKSEHQLIGASPFPRHWLYGSDGHLAGKSGLIDFADWTRHQDHDRTPWHDFEREVLMSEVESQVERALSVDLMAQKPELLKLDAETVLIEQGAPGGSIYLILDGMLRVAVDDEDIAELGPGAIVGERAVLEGGVATATVTTRTPTKAAKISADALDRDELAKVAKTHHREDG